MILALAIVMALIWLMLWGIFHLAGGIVHGLLAAAFALLVYRLIRASDLRTDQRPHGLARPTDY